jgi:hypothetical protein
MFNNVMNSLKPYSHVSNREFIWVAGYLDGSMLAEFDFQTYKDNDFEAIRRDNLLTFGLLGHGLKMYFDTATGIFNLAGNEYEIIYKADDKEYNLTGQYQLYNDIIQYKSAFTDFDPFAKEQGYAGSAGIFQYNFGYKNRFNIDGTNFSFKAICKMPLNQPIHLALWLVADADLNGQIVIKKNGITIEKIDAPIVKNVGGDMNWVVK